MSDEFDGGQSDVAAVATKRAKATPQFHVFRLNADGSWSHETEAGSVAAGSRKEAIRSVTENGNGEGTFVAVRESEWKPKTRSVETKTVDEWS